MYNISFDFEYILSLAIKKANYVINKISTFAISYNNLRHEPSYNNPRAKQFQVMDLIEIVSVQTGLQESMK